MLDNASLDALLTRWETIEYVAEAGVIAGCVGEFIAEFTTIKTPAWRHRFSRFSLIVLMASLAVELGALYRTNSLSGEQIAQTQRDTARLTKEAETERLARAKLEQQMGWRSLSKEQGEAVCSALHKIPGKLITQTSITSSSQDAEAFRYAQDFDRARRECILSVGLQPSGGVGNSFWAQNVVFGVWVRFPMHFTLDNPNSPDVLFNPEKRRALAESVRDELQAGGIRVAGISADGTSLIDIYVGPKAPLEIEKP